MVDDPTDAETLETLGHHHREMTQETYHEWVSVAAFYDFLRRGTDDALAPFGVVKSEFGDQLTDWYHAVAQIDRKLRREGISVE